MKRKRVKASEKSVRSCILLNRNKSVKKVLDCIQKKQPGIFDWADNRNKVASWIVKYGQ